MVVIRFERIREILNTKAHRQFLKYMKGQTIMEGGVFEDDFLRFVKKYPVID
jgi:hypothetical protein